MRTGRLRCLSNHAFHEMAFTEWGDADNTRVLICAHGLTRNGRDFDSFASVLAEAYRVVCPDVVGRGRSEWLNNKEDYNYSTYCANMAALIAALQVEEVDWLGTSMGGIIGMLLAAQPNTPVRRLVLNDVGALIPQRALEDISQYVGKDPRFDSMDEVERYLRAIHAGFGPLTDAQWAHLARHSVRSTEDGEFALAYDPGIADSFWPTDLADVHLWEYWDNIRCPMLVIRGADSDLLLPATVAEMQQRGPPMELVELPGVGHAPALMADDQIDIVKDWLLTDRVS
ncbi:MAG: alpha/beta fold hydrolase [Acidiferrobacterales bacterium]